MAYDTYEIILEYNWVVFHPRKKNPGPTSGPWRRDLTDFELTTHSLT